MSNCISVIAPTQSINNHSTLCTHTALARRYVLLGASLTFIPAGQFVSAGVAVLWTVNSCFAIVQVCLWLFFAVTGYHPQMCVACTAVLQSLLDCDLLVITFCRCFSLFLQGSAMRNPSVRRMLGIPTLEEMKKISMEVAKANKVRSVCG